MVNLALAKRLITDKRYFIETVLQLEDKQRNVIPFKLNPIQSDMLASMTGRDVYVKPAQVGSTSLWMGAFVHDCITRPGTTSVVIAHEEFITQRLLEKAHRFSDTIEQLPGFPKPYHKSSYELSWPDLHTTFYIGSARSYVFGRGEAIHNLLCSEYAFWADPEKILIPAMQRVPPDGKLIIESTPNGEDNSFHELYNSAKELSYIGKSRFASHFYAWFQHPEYQLDVDSLAALPIDRVSPLEYTEDELRLIRLYDVGENQIRWRRMKIAELEQLRRSGELVSLFGQEFPEDDVSCFIAAGNMYYDTSTLAELSQRATKPLTTIDDFRVWRRPNAKGRYLVAVDPGMGKITRSAITVWEFGWNSDGEEHIAHCATLAAIIPPEKTAEKARDIARRYGNAMIAVEANGHGLAVLSELKDYHNIYRRTDIVSGRRSMEKGWLTSAHTTKPFMMKELAKMLPTMELFDQDIIDEIKNIRVKPNGEVTHIGYDDLHDSAAIAMATRPGKPIVRGYLGSYIDYKRRVE